MGETLIFVIYVYAISISSVHKIKHTRCLPYGVFLNNAKTRYSHLAETNIVEGSDRERISGMRSSSQIRAANIRSERIEFVKSEVH